MRLWPRSLLTRLLIIVMLGLLLANALSLTLVMLERMRSARTVMLGNLEYDVSTWKRHIPGCRASPCGRCASAQA